MSLLCPTLERVITLRYTKGPTGLAQLCSVNTRLIKKYWLVTQVPPRIAALNQLTQCTEYTQYSAGQPIPRELLPSSPHDCYTKANGE